MPTGFLRAFWTQLSSPCLRSPLSISKTLSIPLPVYHLPPPKNHQTPHCYQTTACEVPQPPLPSNLPEKGRKISSRRLPNFLMNLHSIIVTATLRHRLPPPPAIHTVVGNRIKPGDYDIKTTHPDFQTTR
ncbi:unnamed protein product [Lactuca saligna]|uniref:Uncharacterized protein n=1 Tax=Lactuca saligna TaxID=75948 RepID=A0AA36ELG9_LACSI|nr:unnamed protein product [Lactuca saligna]